MPLPAATIEDYLRKAFPDARIELTDTAGDQDHYSLKIISEAFRGKTRIEQHKMVYAALQGSMTHTLHALQVQTGCEPQ